MPPSPTSHSLNQILRSEELGIYDATTGLCSSCTQLDLGSMLNHQSLPEVIGVLPQYYRSTPSINLDSGSPTIVTGSGSCPLCRFFYRVAKTSTAGHGIQSDPQDAKTFEAPHLLYSLTEARIGFRGWTKVFDGFFVSEQQQDSNVPRSVILPVSENTFAFSGRVVEPLLDFGMVKGWLRICKEAHESVCDISALERTERLPPGFAVIDCKKRVIVSWSYLQHTWGRSDPPPFVALSYVWGSLSTAEAAFVNEGTASDFGLGRRLPAVLPLTIEDAITVCKRLEYSYLWVDRYCIPQNQPEMKHIQINAMDAVYQCASLTIIAAAGSNSDYGLPGISTRFRTTQPRVSLKTEKIPNRDDKSMILVACPDIWDTMCHSVWNTRAWTYQEGLLSRRKLMFTDHQVYFQCLRMHCVEATRAPGQTATGGIRDTGVFVFGGPLVQRMFPEDDDDPRDMVARINEYVGKKLTVDSDIQNAFEGITSVFLSRPGARVIAALPLVPMFHLSLAHVSFPTDWSHWDPSGEKLSGLSHKPSHPVQVHEEHGVLEDSSNWQKPTNQLPWTPARGATIHAKGYMTQVFELMVALC